MTVMMLESFFLGIRWPWWGKVDNGGVNLVVVVDCVDFVRTPISPSGFEKSLAGS